MYILLIFGVKFHLSKNFTYIFENYSNFNYLVTVLDIFITIYYYGERNYFITIVMKFDNYFPSFTY